MKPLLCPGLCRKRCRIFCLCVVHNGNADEHGVLRLRITGAVFVLLQTGQSRSAIPSEFVFTCSWFTAVQDYVTNLLPITSAALLDAVRLARSSRSHRTKDSHALAREPGKQTPRIMSFDSVPGTCVTWWLFLGMSPRRPALLICSGIPPIQHV